jgi:hypothetical protein
LNFGFPSAVNMAAAASTADRTKICFIRFVIVF